MTLNRVVKSSIVLGAVLASFVSRDARAQYTYGGPILTDVSGMSCRSVTENQEESNFYRELTNGFSTGTAPAGTAYSVSCPIARRNTTVYGTASVTSRPLMTRLQDRLPTAFSH